MKPLYLTATALSVFLLQANAQTGVSSIYTDYNGFWQSAAGNVNSVKPDNSHNLLAFTVGSTTYSTGVNDAILTTNNVPFSPEAFKALPVASIPSGGVLGVGNNYGGFAGQPAGQPVPVTNNFASYLMDGIQGLDLGTGIYNSPVGAERKYTVSSANASAIGGSPDIIINQIGQPPSSTENDILRFYDAAGNTVGNTVTVDVSALPIVGTGNWKFYQPGNPPTYEAVLQGPRDIRLLTFDLADFGITAANIGNITGFGHTLSGKSDQAFTAYNSASLVLYQSISGTVHIDPSGGTPTGPGYTGEATIELLDNDNNVIAATTTDESGNYSFPNIAPGSYTIRLTVPSSYTVTGASDGGNDNLITVSITNAPFIASFGIANPLPVTLLHFDAYKKANSVLLHWATAKEQNNKGFQIERSTDSRNWITIGFVATQAKNGNSHIKSDYSFTDNTPGNGQNFYRLKQVDFEGAYEYSPVRLIAFDKENRISIYPNPATERVSIAGLQGGEQIHVLDLAAGKVYQMTAKDVIVDIPLDQLSAGNYLIHIIGTDGSISSYKLVKSK